MRVGGVWLSAIEMRGQIYAGSSNLPNAPEAVVADPARADAEIQVFVEAHTGW